jgi:hypothetical protein
MDTIEVNAGEQEPRVIENGFLGSLVYYILTKRRVEIKEFVFAFFCQATTRA